MRMKMQTCWLCLALACSGAPHAPSGILGAGSSAVGVAGTAMLPAGGAGAGPGASGSSGAVAVSAGRGGSAGSSIKPTDAGPADAAVVRADAADEDDASVARPSHSTGAGDWVAGDYPPGLSGSSYLEISGVPGQGSNVRQYKVHVPPSYKPNVPAPV